MGYEKVVVAPKIGGFSVNESTKIIDYPLGGIDVDERYFSISDVIRLYVGIEGYKDMLYDCIQENGTARTDVECVEATQKYYAQASEIGDTLFNQWLRTSSEVAMSTLARIKSVIISSDKDFNTAHPAGSSLNDLFTIYFNDPYALIKNNYRPIEGTYTYLSGDNLGYPFAIFKETLSSVRFIERPFIDHRWDIVLNVGPETSDTYIFYVKVVLEDDSVLEAETSINIQGTSETI
ncbi:MAG: hypothetical protein LBR10_05925 [Prevotellaceae bacterium]|jgi:hypothetical protein|nr:hypothetical protein [Prevotellaceae bacterium]